MTPSPKDPNINMLEAADDLTQFADESFDTESVDLFEFTGEENSPLNKLKQIVLSLDWEINEDTLLDFNAEVERLKENFQDDRTALVYLEGLTKLGHYLQSEGAYAHPNAIKLLLTFYYDLEKILSTDGITDQEIKELLESDVRKFKILQYQIKQGAPRIASADQRQEGKKKVSEEMTLPGGGVSEEALQGTPLQGLKATILGIEWEVTDKGLEQFNQQLERVQEQAGHSKGALVLIRGLQVLHDYIAQEAAAAHPEAFTLLHPFYEGLEKILTDDNLDAEAKQKILTHCVDRLNNLKGIIAAEGKEEALEEVPPTKAEAPKPAEEEEAAAEEVAAEESGAEPPAESEAGDTGLVATAAATMAAGAAALEITEPDEADKVESLVEEDLASGDDSDIATETVSGQEDSVEEITEDLVDLADEDVLDAELDDDIDADEILANFEKTVAEDDLVEDIDSQLDALFEEGAAPASLRADGEEAVDADELLDPSAITPVDDDFATDLFGGDLTFGDEEDEIADLTSMDVLGGIGKEAAQEEEFDLQVDDLNALELDEEESRAGGEEGLKSVDEEELILEGFDEEIILEEPAHLSQKSADGSGVIQEEPAAETEGGPAADDQEAIIPALMDVEEELEEGLEASAEGGVSLGDELSEKLDAFFPEDEESALDSTVPADEPAETEPEEVDEFSSITPALADITDELAVAGNIAAVEPDEPLDIDDRLDAFFTLPDETGEIAIEQPAEGGEEQELEAEPTPDGGEEETSEEPAPALAEFDDSTALEAVAETADQESIPEVDAKLDDFFTTEEPPEEEPLPLPEAVSSEEPLAEDVAPALADEEFGEEVPSPADEGETPADIEEKLEAFFGQDEAKTKEGPAVDKGLVTAAGGAVAASVMTVATADDTTGSEGQPVPLDKDKLADLEHCLAEVVATPSADLLSKGATLVADLQGQVAGDLEKGTILQLIDSVLFQLPKVQAFPPETTGSLLEGLHKQLQAPAATGATTLDLVGQYTRWQHELVDLVAREAASVEAAAPASQEDTMAATLQTGLAELKQELRELRQEFQRFSS